MNPASGKSNTPKFGTVVSVHGSVVDIGFEARLPSIYSLLRAGPKGQIAIEVLSQLDRAVRTILDAAFERAVVILKERRDTLERGARELLAHETLNEDALRGLVQPAPAGAAQP